MNKKELWLKLRSYHFSHLVNPNLWEQISTAFGGADAFTRAFADKIARKNGWKKQFALRAVSEYKKFVYLGVISNFQVTPSKAIDVVWHEHLLFSRGYRQFCDEVIEYQFDHHPELVPLTDETGRFDAQFRDTLELYQTEFGKEPPEDIWGITKYDKDKLRKNRYQPQTKTNAGGVDDYSYSYVSEPPLCDYFDGGGHDFSFGGGETGGAGSSGDWSDGNAHDSSSDAGSDSSDSGGDSGSCSSCSGGGCGGGCGGGGD